MRVKELINTKLNTISPKAHATLTVIIAETKTSTKTSAIVLKLCGTSSTVSIIIKTIDIAMAGTIIQVENLIIL